MTTTYNVSSEGAAASSNTDTTTLNGAIRTIDTGAAGDYVINVTGTIDLTDELLAINLPVGSTLTINGGSGAVLDGLGDQRGLFVYSGTVTIENLTLQNMKAQGGAGGSGGGGGGLGGGLFVAGTNGSGGHDPSQAVVPDVTLTNVIFSNDAAVGGNAPTSGLYGGGGLGGGDGDSVSGGGIGLSALGGSTRGNGGPGIVPAAAPGGNGGASGGGGGGGGGGGIGGAAGGDGGFGGGGRRRRRSRRRRRNRRR
jgi:hypothetical protein